jgi:hypothetical protein
VNEQFGALSMIAVASSREIDPGGLVIGSWRSLPAADFGLRLRTAWSISPVSSGQV